MTWVTWRQYRYQGVLAAALFAALAVVLLFTGLHAAQVWHSALAGCAKHGARARDRNEPVRLDAEHHQAALAGGQGRMAAARRGRPGRSGVGPGHLVDGPGPRADR